MMAVSGTPLRGTVDQDIAESRMSWSDYKMKPIDISALMNDGGFNGKPFRRAIWRGWVKAGRPGTWGGYSAMCIFLMLRKMGMVK
jgi:hypothetical protein